MEIVPGHPGTPSLSRAIPHVFPIVQALKHPSTQAPAPRHPQASLSFSGSLACTKTSFLLFHSLHCRALASILPLSLHSSLLPTLLRIHLSIRPAKSFLTHRPPDSNSCSSISPWSRNFLVDTPYRCTSSVRSFNLDSSPCSITNLVPYLQFSLNCLHTPCLAWRRHPTPTITAPQTVTNRQYSPRLISE